MRRGRSDPPRRAEALLVRLLPASLAECVAGDLREGYAARAAARGRVRAAVWYWAQVLTFRYLAVRRAARSAWPAPERVRRGGRLLPDLRAAVRGARTHGALSLLVVGTVALGVCAVTVVYGVVDGVLLRPLPYPESGRIVQVYSTYEEWREAENPLLRAFALSFPVSYPVFEDWRAGARSVESIGAYDARRVTVSGGERPDRVAAAYVTADVFAVLGVRPALGRRFTAEEDRPGGPALAVLSDGYWRRAFGGDRSVVGRTLTIDERPYTVVGVMPRGFYFPDAEAELWLSFTDAMRARGRGSQFLESVARLRDGVTIAEAQRDFDGVVARTQQPTAEEASRFGVRVASRVEEVVGETRPALLLLLGAAGLVLAIACVNVANLLLVRATARRRELAVRAALGAARGNLVRMLLGETLVLAGAGGIAGTAAAVLALPAVIALLPASLPRTVEIVADGRVLGFALATTMVTALLAGAGPAWLGARSGLAGVLRDEARGSVTGRGGARAQAALVVAEVALAFLLLGATGLLGRSLVRTLAVDPGFDRDNLIVAHLSLPAGRYADAPATLGFAERVRERLRALPGVAAVAIAEDAPFAGGHSAGDVLIAAPQGGAPVEANVDQAVVSDAYDAALGVPLVEGRFFSPADRAGAAPVAVVSRALADRYWPDRSPLGQRIKDGDAESDDPWRTVIGVVGDVHHAGLTTPPAPKLYMPLAQHADAAPSQIVLVRVATDDAAILSQLPQLVAALDPGVPVTRTARMRELVSRSAAVARFRTLLIGGLAGLAALLAIAGLYGVLAFTVACRVPEFGVRMALGARAERVLRDVIARGLRLGATGIALGAAVGLVAFRPLERFLFRITPTDPATLGAIALLLLATAAAAAWLPARRAARVDPLEALRRE